MESDRAAMAVSPKPFLNVDLENDEQVIKAVRRAVADALRTHKENGWYVVGRQNGKPVRVEPEDIVVPEVAD